MKRFVVTRWRPVMLAGVVAFFALMVSHVVRADDDEDAQRLEESIDRKLSDMRGPIRDAARDQSDGALDKLSDASDKAREVLSMAEELRSKNTSDDHKRSGEKHAEAARAYLDAAQGLRQMKAAEVKLHAAEWPRRCEDLDAKLKDFVSGIVDHKDHEGPQKIRDFAETQGKPVRESIAALHGQENDFSSWSSQAERFSYSDGGWSDVRSEFQDARNYTRDGWKKLLEDTDRGCERVTKWEENRIVTDALRALGEHSRSKDEVRAELATKLEEMTRLVTGVERNSSDSEVQSAINDADAISNSIDKLKEVAGTDPAARTIVEKWPEYVHRFKDAAALVSKMKEREYLVDHAKDRCQAVEGEFLGLIKDLLDKVPFDQDREPFLDDIADAIDRSAVPIADKLKAADQYEEELKSMADQVKQFDADDPAWKPVFEDLQQSAVAIYEYYKGANREAHLVCDMVSAPRKNPHVQQAIWGSCNQSQYNGLVTDKNNACNRDRACKGNNTNCADLQRRRDMCQECWDARKAVMDTCYGGGDERHEKELNKTFTSVDNCDDALRKNNCK